MNFALCEVKKKRQKIAACNKPKINDWSEKILSLRSPHSAIDPGQTTSARLRAVIGDLG